uniref:Endo16 protein n=1 Tax=Strongylocentrotus purpuratus TaxID=7668 RepID=Q9N2N4_STRPU|nr:endoderm-specific marker gene [Strongylocentrotus purpuratus]
MMRLNILLFAVLAVARSMPTGKKYNNFTKLQCDIDEAHTNVGTPRVVDDDSNSLMIFQL